MAVVMGGRRGVHAPPPPPPPPSPRRSLHPSPAPLPRPPGHVVICVAEGAGHDMLGTAATDASGHPILADIGL